jgi:signal transduction histidine kinase
MSSQPAFSSKSTASLESVISTAELRRRPTRPANYVAENNALIALARAMVTSPDGILQKLAETALALCHAGSAGISLLEPDGAHFHWPAITGAWAAQTGGGTPREYGPCGTVLDRNAPQLMSHPERHFTYLAEVTPSIEEVLLIPFYIAGKAVGTIWVIAHDAMHPFDGEDLRVMTNLGIFAASAYQTLASMAQTAATQGELRDSRKVQRELEDQAQTIERRTAQLRSANELLRELSARLMEAQDEERRRIARELHDTTGQTLAALSMSLAQMQNDSSPANAVRFAECLKLISSASSEIRSLSYLLHPPLIEELGLGSAIREYATGFESRCGIRIMVETSDDVGRLQDHREIVLFRIVQESLGNVHRHSGSPTANIRMFRDRQDVVLEIADQGRGMKRGEDGRLRYGVGLRSIQERLRPFSGTLSIESSAAGTKVKIVLPQATSIVE